MWYPKFSELLDLGFPKNSLCFSLSFMIRWQKLKTIDSIKFISHKKFIKYFILATNMGLLVKNIIEWKLEIWVQRYNETLEID